MDSKEIIKRLKAHGFERVHQVGSHIKFRHPDGRTVTVPHPKKDIPIGTLKSIWKQANIQF